MEIIPYLHTFSFSIFKIEKLSCNIYNHEMTFKLQDMRRGKEPTAEQENCISQGFD